MKKCLQTLYKVSICKCERKTWNALYEVKKISQGEDGANPPFQLCEFEETGKLEVKE